MTHEVFEIFCSFSFSKFVWFKCFWFFFFNWIFPVFNHLHFIVLFNDNFFIIITPPPFFFSHFSSFSDDHILQAVAYCLYQVFLKRVVFMLLTWDNHFRGSGLFCTKHSLSHNPAHSLCNTSQHVQVSTQDSAAFCRWEQAVIRNHHHGELLE